MKKILFSLSILLFTFGALAQNTGKVDIYYFHITHRCNTCTSIEAQVRKTLDTHFATQQQDGTITLHVLNCELPENKAISDKYLAYGSTLALTSWPGGKESIEDITGWAFQKINNPELFISELKAKIEETMKRR